MRRSYGGRTAMGRSRSIRSASSCGWGGCRLDQRKYQLGLRTSSCARSRTNGAAPSPLSSTAAHLRQRVQLDSGRFLPDAHLDEYLEGLIRAAAETHQNMLRVWGGGFYEEERFYDLCDRYGILVWQDFIFSCSIYPLG
jgi:beta-mannosidase